MKKIKFKYLKINQLFRLRKNGDLYRKVRKNNSFNAETVYGKFVSRYMYKFREYVKGNTIVFIETSKKQKKRKLFSSYLPKENL